MANYSAETDYTRIWKAGSFPSAFQSTNKWIDEATNLINIHLDRTTNITDIGDAAKRAEMILVNIRYQYYRCHQTSNGMVTFTAPNGLTYTRPARDMHLKGCNYKGCPHEMAIAELRVFKKLFDDVRVIGEDGENHP